MASPALSPTINGRLAPSIQTHSPSRYRSPQSGSPKSAGVKTPGSSAAPLLKTRSPIGTSPHGPPRTKTHPGCVLCGFVASASAQTSTGSSAPPSPNTPAIPLPSPARAATPDLRRAGPSMLPPSSPTLATEREIHVSGHRIIFHDHYLTVFVALEKEALCPDGRHIIIILNEHLATVYDLGPGDIPLLSHIINTARRLLGNTLSSGEAERGLTAKDIRVGFVNGMPRDPQFPYPHLHAQAFLGPFDKKLPGSTLWRRNVVYSTLNWWSVEDLRAEIREETSNNRVKSGYDDRDEAPINNVPDAGAHAGLPNALDPDAYAPKSSPTSPMDKDKGKGKVHLPMIRTESNQSNTTVKPSPYDEIRSPYTPRSGSPLAKTQSGHRTSTNTSPTARRYGPTQDYDHSSTSSMSSVDMD